MIRFVTSNEHKYQEVSAFAVSFGVTVEWEKMEYEEIQADSTEEISLDSCKKLTNVIKGDFFMEDTGLFIEALNGFPGVYSSYVLKTIGNAGVLKLLQGKERSAKFRTVATASIGGNVRQYAGELDGTITNEIRGNGGFGFDPIFLPEGSRVTLAEMSLEDKNRISHRFRALAGLFSEISDSSQLHE